VADLKWSAHPEAGWEETENAFQFQCLGCHATNSSIGFDPATKSFDTRWTEMGVGCEACHGPGRSHIEADIPDKAGTILNPAKLPDPRRAAMVCGACHTRGTSPDGQFAYPVDYQPGDQLNFMFDELPGVYPDGSPNSHHQQYNDWRASGHSAAGVNCWDCHSPHIRGKSNRFQLKLPGSMLCRSCHSVKPKGVHGLHSADNCIGCHMPNTIKSAVQGDLRSHRFLVARPEHTLIEGSAEAQPNSCNLCHYHKKEDPERLVHYLNAVKKPARCKACHYHAEQDPDEENE
jgi:predicted CXXCH cytochrome family protein